MQGAYMLAAANSGSNNILGMLIPLALIILVFYLLFWRPQQKRRQQEQQMQATLRPGVEVLTKTGFYATVIEVRENDVDLELSPGVRMRMIKMGIGEVITPNDGVADDTPVEDRPDFPGDDKGDGPR